MSSIFKEFDFEKFRFIIFGDGACSGNPGPGGWGAVILDVQKSTVIELGGAAKETTNNKMEITAAGQALRELENKEGSILLLTDSKYVIEGITKWIWGWQTKNWKKADGKPVANRPFWERLLELVESRNQPIEWRHVAGHAGIAGNERVDEIAQAYSLGQSVDLYKGPLADYPHREVFKAK